MAPWLPLLVIFFLPLLLKLALLKQLQAYWTYHHGSSSSCRASRKCRSAPQVNPKFTLLTSTKVRTNTDANAPGRVLRACLGRCMCCIADKARAPFAPRPSRAARGATPLESKESSRSKSSSIYISISHTLGPCENVPLQKKAWVFGWEAVSKIESLLVYDSLFFSSAYLVRAPTASHRRLSLSLNEKVVTREGIIRC